MLSKQHFLNLTSIAVVKNNMLYIDGGIETYIDLANNTAGNTMSQAGKITTGYSEHRQR